MLKRFTSRAVYIVLLLAVGVFTMLQDGGWSLNKEPDHPSGKAAVTVRQCIVSSVHDGDSMRVRCPGFSKTLRIRLEEIDAPELNQAHGIKSRDFLQAMCPNGASVTVFESGLDHYQRHLARVQCDGRDANAALVEAGLAWVYDRYAQDPGLYVLQDEAKAEKRGLWSAKQPQAPWEFRRAATR